jgi:microcystin-dependent protein
MYFAGKNAPTGWLKANGALLPKQGTYASLYDALPKQTNGTQTNTIWSVIGDNWAPNGEFRIPDLRGQFIRGWNDNTPAIGSGVNPTTDPTSYQFGIIQNPYAGYNTFSTTLDDGDDRIAAQKSIFSITVNGITMGDSFGNKPDTYTPLLGPYDIPTKPGDTRPTNMALLACIKY